MKTLNAISLFSGSGMLDRGTDEAVKELGYELRTTLYCERDKYACSILEARMQDGQLHKAPVWKDVSTLNATTLRGHIDCIVAGFPCQPFSLAGKRACLEDERYLFGDIIRIAEEARIPLLFLENVPGLLSSKKDTAAPVADVMRLLAEAGFDATWRCVSASEAGAPHKRERFFCIAWRTVADSECDGQAGPTLKRVSGDVPAAKPSGPYILPNAA